MSDLLDVNALSQSFLADPYPVLNEIREQAPATKVLWHGLPVWLVTRFADVQAAYSDPRLSALKEHARPELLEVPWVVASAKIGLGRNLVHLDPPDHTRLRRLVTKAFTARRVENLRGFTEDVADELAGKLVANGGGDLMRDFSVPLACRVIMELLGVPADDAAAFGDHTMIFISTDPADRARMPETIAWISAYIGDLIEAKSSQPDDGLLSALIAARDEGTGLTAEELGSMMLLLLMAGFETTANLVGTGTLTLLRNPDQLAALRADLDLLPKVVEEMLRFESTAVASLPKFATEDLEIGGVRIPKGDAVIVSWSAANRDPRRFPNPDAFELGRDGTHLAFAHGFRYCLGAPLARMEAVIAFRALLTRCPDLRLAVPESELGWKVTPTVRGLRALLVSC